MHPHLILLLPQRVCQQWAHHAQAVAPQLLQLLATVGGWRLQLGVVGGAQALPARAHAAAQRALRVQLSQVVQAPIAVQQAPAAAAAAAAEAQDR
jgi:hypothetical protein